MIEFILGLFVGAMLGVLKPVEERSPDPEPEPVAERVIEQPPKDRMLRSKAIGKRVRR